MDTAAAILDSCESVFSQCDIPTKQELLKISFLIISFILGTVDMVTDWINWKQWISFGGYDQHYLMYIFQTTFFCVAVLGTILWIVEVFLMIIRARESFRRHQKRSKPGMKSHEHNGHNSKHSPFSDRLGMVVRILTGLLEDLPVANLIHYTVILPFCGVPAKRESTSPTTIAALVSSMLNSMWTMFILYWELCGCNKKVTEGECCCCMLFRSIYKPQTSLCVYYCGWCGYATTSQCECIFLSKSQAKQLNNGSHSQTNPIITMFKKIVLGVGKIVLLGIILLLFLGIFILGVLTLSNVYDTPILDWWMEFNTERTKAIKADTIGPGLDARQDGAMFVTMVYKLPN